MDLYIFINFLRVAVLRIHLMLFDRIHGNHFKAEIFRECTGLNDILHISYYYGAGQFKLLTIPSLLGLLKRAKIKKMFAKADYDGLGCLFG